MQPIMCTAVTESSAETQLEDDTRSRGVHATVHAMPGDETEIARKLRMLLERLGISASEFARQTGLSQAYLSKLKTGDRAGDPKKALSLRVAARDVFGVPDVYWQPCAQVELPTSLGPAKLRPMNMASFQQHQQHNDFKRQLAELSAELGDPPDVVVALLRESPPSGRRSDLVGAAVPGAPPGRWGSPIAGPAPA